MTRAADAGRYSAGIPQVFLELGEKAFRFLDLEGLFARDPRKVRTGHFAFAAFAFKGFAVASGVRVMCRFAPEANSGPSP